MCKSAAQYTYTHTLTLQRSSRLRCERGNRVDLRAMCACTYREAPSSSSLKCVCARYGGEEARDAAYIHTSTKEGEERACLVVDAGCIITVERDLTI